MTDYFLSGRTVTDVRQRCSIQHGGPSYIRCYPDLLVESEQTEFADYSSFHLIEFAPSLIRWSLLVTTAPPMDLPNWPARSRSSRFDRAWRRLCRRPSRRKILYTDTVPYLTASWYRYSKAAIAGRHGRNNRPRWAHCSEATTAAHYRPA